MKYIKETPRIEIKIYNSLTDELLITISDRNWMNVGDMFPQHTITSLILDEFKNKNKPLPKKILVMVAEEYELTE